MNRIIRKFLASRGELVYDFEIDPTNNSAELVGRILHSFASLGYTLHPDSIKQLINGYEEDLTKFYNEYILLLSDLKGTSTGMATVFYKNFPDFSNVSEGQFTVNAILHYLTIFFKDNDLIDDELVFLNQFEEVNDREEESPNIELKVLKVIDNSDEFQRIIEYFKNQFSQKVAIADSNMMLLKEIYNSTSMYSCLNTITGITYRSIAPEEIPFKENLALYLSFIGNDLQSLTEEIRTSKYIKTVTDILRIYTILSGGDVSNLKHKTNYKSFPRFLRKAFLYRLNEICKNNSYAYDDFYKYEYEWVRVFENLHPGDYAKNYNNIYKMADAIRNVSTIKTYNGKIELAYKKQNINQLLALYKIKPGVFARSLDRILRSFPFDYQTILNSFSDVCSNGNISIPLLVQLYDYFYNREDTIKTNKELNQERLFVVKQRTLHSKETRISMPDHIIKAILDTIKKAINKMSAKENPINIYFDESLKNYGLPENNRDASENYAAIPSGSRINLPEMKNCIRFFTHWNNLNLKAGWGNRVDIDLSVHFFDKDFNYVDELSWRSYGRMFKKDDCAFSGDITDAPQKNGASEFVDIYTEALRNNNVKYVVSANTVFSGPEFKDIPNCFSGVMFRENLGKKGEIYSAKEVETKFDLTASAKNNYGFIYDVENNQLINLDKSLAVGRIAATGSKALIKFIKKYSNLSLNLYDLLEVECGARFKRVEKPEDAEIIISNSEDATIKPFEQEKLANLLF